MLLPAFLMHINSTFSAVVNMGYGFFSTNRAFHDSLPPLSISLAFPSAPVVTSSVSSPLGFV